MDSELFYDDKNNYELQIVFVLTDREEDKASVKRFLDGKGVVFQFLLEQNMRKKTLALAVMGNILKQVNAKMGGAKRMHEPQGAQA